MNDKIYEFRLNFNEVCVYTALLAGYTSVKTSESVYKTWPTDRVHIERSGIHFIVYQKGRLGRFDIGSLVLVFITGGGLRSAATRFVEILATTFGEQRYSHRASMVEDVSRKDV